MRYNSTNVFIKWVIRILKSVDNKIIFPRQYCLLVQQIWLSIAKAFNSCPRKFLSKIKFLTNALLLFRVDYYNSQSFFKKWLQTISPVYTIYLSLLACTSVSSYCLLFLHSAEEEIRRVYSSLINWLPKPSSSFLPSIGTEFQKSQQ